MTRDQAHEKGWKCWAPMGGESSVGHMLKNDAERGKLNGGFWCDENGEFICWDVEFETTFRQA